MLRDGDSLLTTPRPVCLNEPGIDTYEEVARESQATRRANLIRIDDEVTNPARDTVALNGYTIAGLNALAHPDIAE